MSIIVLNRKIFFLILLILFSLFTSQPSSAAAPEITGEAAVLLDGKNGHVLFEKNPHQKIYPASTTKILTAIVALENGRLDDLVTIQEGECNIDGSALGLVAGEKIYLGDLLYAMMLVSGNDAAVAIARHIGGSVDGFVAMMNKKAAELEAVNSYFNNPNGLPDPKHYTTAYDMALIARYAMQNPEFRKIADTKVKTIRRQVPEAQTFLLNHNKLLWRYGGAIGVKTGYTSDARQCLIAAAERDGRELISVVMKSEGNDIWTDSEKLLEYGYKEFTSISLTEAGRYVIDVPVRFGTEKMVPLQTGFPLTCNLPRDKQDGIKKEVMLRKDITAPVRAGEKLGELVFFAGEWELGRVDLLAQQEIARRISAQWWPWFFLAAGLFVIASIIRYHRRIRRRRWEKYYRRKYYSYRKK